MDWNTYFINIAKAVSQKSKDPSTKVGCVLVTKDHRPISFGYNGFISGCNEDMLTYDRPLKYHLICHSEINAVLFAEKSLKSAICYCTHAPCENCIKYLLQAGVREFYYENSDPIKRSSKEQQQAALLLLFSMENVICKNVITGKTYENELRDILGK